MSRHVTALSILWLVCPILLSTTSLANTTSPVEVVETLHSALIKVMKEADSLGYTGRRDILAPVVRASFDSSFMARKTIGRHWNELNDEDRERWLDHFLRHTISNYAGRFSGYAGEHFKTVGREEAPHDTVLVRTTLVIPEDTDVKLNYRLRKVAEGWRIVDIYMNGTVSELALRRSEYGSTLKRRGFENLLAALAEKIAVYEASSDSTLPASLRR